MKILFVILLIVGVLYFDVFADYSRFNYHQNKPFTGHVVDSAKLKLHVPYPVMFKDESPHVIVGIKNFSTNDITIFKHMEWFLEADGYASQLWFEYDTGDAKITPTDEERRRTWQSMIDAEFSHRQLLRSNEQLVTHTRDMWMPADWRDVNARSVRALLMIGDDQYLASDWQEVSFLDDSFEDGAESFMIEYYLDSEILREHIPNYDGISRAPAFVNDIDGEKWLFIRNFRLCKVPESSDLRIDIDEETQIMTIHFDGTDYEPVVHNIRMIRTISGPRKLIPHFYAVKDMEAELSALTSAHALPDSRDLIAQLDQTFSPLSETDQPSESASEPADVTAPEVQSLKVWFWLVFSLLAIVGIVAVIRRR